MIKQLGDRNDYFASGNHCYLNNLTTLTKGIFVFEFLNILVILTGKIHENNYKTFLKIKPQLRLLLFTHPVSSIDS